MRYLYDPVSNSFFAESETANQLLSTTIPQIVWVITDKCIYRCPFCFQPKTNTEFSVNHLKEYIQLFKQLGVQKIDVSGGEPLYYKNLTTVVDSLLAHGISVTISSNGSGTEDNQKWIIDNSGRLGRIIISLNGPTEGMCDQLCGKKGAFSSFLSFYKRLKVSGCKNIRINTVITNIYLDNENIISLVETIKDLAPDEWCLIEPHPDNKLPTFDNYTITTKQFLEIVQSIEEKLDKTKTSIITRTISNYSGYWILNPDGKLMLHSDGCRKPICIPFSAENIVEILATANEYGLWLPINKFLRRNSDETV